MRPFRRRHPRTEAQAIASIREHLAALGSPIDHVTDDELRERVARLVASARAAGVSAADAGEALRSAGKSGIEFPPRPIAPTFTFSWLHDDGTVR
jgi:hypothetical protein